LEEAGPVLQYFFDMSPTQLEARFRDGQTCLAVFGTKILPRLVTRDSILENEQLDYSSAATAGLLPAVLEVQRIWEFIKLEAGKLKPKKETGTKKEAVPK
jgi:hypothetical protein